MTYRLLLLILVLGAAALRAADAQPTTLDADNLSSAPDPATGERVTVARGNAILRGENVLLTADLVRHREAAGVVEAEGRVVFTRGGARLLADKLTYRRADGTFSAENVRLGSPPYFASGSSASGTRDEITLNGARVTYGEPGPWQPTIVADTVVIAPGKRIRTVKAAAGIGHAQPLTLPRFDHEFARPFAAAVGFAGGFRRSLGLFADAEVLVPVSPSVRLGADFGIFSERGFMAGPAGRYASTDAEERVRGRFRTGYINDHGDKKTDILSRPVPEDRAFAEWQHDQQLTDRLSLKAQLNWWKDSEVIRDFRPRNFFPVQEPDTFAEAIYRGDNYFVSAFTRVAPNSFHRVQERLPEVRFDLLPVALGAGFVSRFEASVAVLREHTVADGTGGSVPWPPFLAYRATTSVDTGPNAVPTRFVRRSETTPSATAFYSGGPDRRSTRADAYYGLERPVAVTEWLSVTPVAGARVTHYGRNSETRLRTRYDPIPITLLPPIPQVPGSLPTPGAIIASPFTHDAITYAEDRSLGSYTRALGEIGFDAALRTSGHFDYKNETWKIDGLRHLFTPRLSYRYIPEAAKGAAHIPLIDRNAFSTYLQPLGLGAQRNLDQLAATNTLRLAFDNVLQTRDRAAGTRDLVALNVATDFRFKRRWDERKVAEIHSDLSLTPAPWLQFDLYQSFAPQRMTLRELNSALTLRDGEAWSVRFTNNFLTQQLQDYAVDGRVRINERFEALTRLHYDSRKRRFNEQAYGIAQNLGNTWLISYVVSVYSGRKRESNFGFNVQVDALRF